jgi:hypothetical protein
VLSYASTTNKIGQLAVKVDNTHIHPKMICGDCKEGIKFARYATCFVTKPWLQSV